MDFVDLPAEVLTDEDTWSEYAGFALAKLSLKCGTIVEYMRKTMQCVLHLNKKNQVFQDMRDMMSNPQSTNNWFKGILRNVEATKFIESNALGETMASQAIGVYVEHRRDISRALRQHGSQESAMRNSAIQMVGMAAGRGGEHSYPLICEPQCSAY